MKNYFHPDEKRHSISANYGNSIVPATKPSTKQQPIYHVTKTSIRSVIFQNYPYATSACTQMQYCEGNSRRPTANSK